MKTLPQSIAAATLLVSRLERLSADSYWAHQASGVRGALLRLVERYESTSSLSDSELRHLENTLQLGYHLLSLAAKEVTASHFRKPFDNSDSVQKG
jgi:Ser/Thr protein kinase RdoA (MazF antagonist)